MYNKLHRRQFLRLSFTATASIPFLTNISLLGAQNSSPNSRITMGFIGTGTQGRHLLNSFLPHADVQVVAVCDVDKTRREHHQKLANDFYTSKTGKEYKDCRIYSDFREVIARKDIDTIVIATPDHWHCLNSVAALNAGKDVYCEKPLSLTIPEARAMVNATRKNNRVFQTGSMQRSSSEFLKACELVRNGRIGKIKEVIVDVGGPSKWCDLAEEPMEPDLDWDMWLGPAPKRPYNSILSPRGVHKNFPAWRSYREYSGGGMTDWGAHHFDIAQWGLGMDDSGPVEIIPSPNPKSGKGVKFRYANGIELIHGTSGGVLFVGEEGKIFVNRGKFTPTPDTIAKDYTPNGLPIKLYRSTNHYRDFINCVRSRQKPICDVEIGCRSVTICHLANIAYWYNRNLKWDPAKEHFVGDSEANSWLDRKPRAPWDQFLSA